MDGGGGAGGLVRAYALLAANVFALSMAFGVLSRSAQVDTLMQAMKQLEVVTGKSVRVVGMELQKVSGYGMDLAESMRATSLAMSAGFDSTAIKELGEVADLKNDKFIILAGQSYIKPIKSGLTHIIEPLKGIVLGKRPGKLKELIKEL